MLCRAATGAAGDEAREFGGPRPPPAPRLSPRARRIRTPGRRRRSSGAWIVPRAVGAARRGRTPAPIPVPPPSAGGGGPTATARRGNSTSGDRDQATREIRRSLVRRASRTPKSRSSSGAWRQRLKSSPSTGERGSVEADVSSAERARASGEIRPRLEDQSFGGVIARTPLRANPWDFVGLV